MPHDVFISYASHDKAVADATCVALEALPKIRCWIAPRDALPGAEYGEAIVSAIEDCRIMVLIFSAHANDSRHVPREVERAVSKGKIILPFRIEDVQPSKTLEYCLGKTHWLDAITPPLQRRIDELVASVSRLLDGAASRKLEPSLSFFRPEVPEPAGLEGLGMQIRQLPRFAQLALGWRCIHRLDGPFIANWIHHTLHDTLGYLNRAFLPAIKSLLQAPIDDKFQEVFSDALKTMNNLMAGANRNSKRMKDPAVINACYGTYLKLIEYGLLMTDSIEPVVYGTYSIYGMINPDNSVTRRELLRDVQNLSTRAAAESWGDETPIPDACFDDKLWLHGEPAFFNPSRQPKRSFFDHLGDLFG